jgi:hypothetical protein
MRYASWQRRGIPTAAPRSADVIATGRLRQRSLTANLTGLIVLSTGFCLTGLVSCDQSTSDTHVHSNQRLKETSPAQGFEYFSGYAMHLNNLPAMYAHGGVGKGQAITVIGRDYQQDFPMSHFSEAVEHYQALLEKQGYRPESIHWRVSPADHPILGTWELSNPDGTCREQETFEADGRYTDVSGDQRSVSTFDIGAEPTVKGYYLLRDTIVETNGKRDCTGDVTLVGDVVMLYIHFSSDLQSYSLCRREDLDSCIATARRVKPVQRR